MKFLIPLIIGTPASSNFVQQVTEPLELAWMKIAEITGMLLPKLIGFLLILIIGWLISKFFAFLIKKILKIARLHILAEKAGIEDFLKKGGIESDSITIISKVAYWFFIIITFIVAFNSVGLTSVSELLNKILLYFPNIFVALVILIIGFYLASFVGSLVRVFSANIGIERADILGKMAYAIVVIFVIPIVLNQLRIAPELVTNAFLLLFGAICLAVGLAFGLGSKDIVAKFWEKSKVLELLKKKK